METLRIGQAAYTLKPMSRGSFVDLFLGQIQSSGRKSKDHSIVVKCMQKDYLNQPLVVQRFELEFAVLKELATKSDRFLAKPTFGKQGGTPYMSYTYVPGVTLISLLKEHAKQDFSLPRCIQLMQRLLSDLALLHSEDTAIVHSDISPENLLVHEEQIRLIDFGCAQHVKGEQRATAWMGKPGYLSPEQARGESWGMASDIYQAGVIFYEMVCGTRWNTGSNVGERIALSSNPVVLHHRISQAPIKARPLLRSMLAPDPDMRPASISLCLKRLGHILAQL